MRQHQSPHKAKLKTLLLRGLNYAEAGAIMGLSRERVRQLAQKYGYSTLRWQTPDGYIPLAEYAKLQGRRWKTVLDRINTGYLPALKLRGQWYVHQNESYRCRTCGGKLDAVLIATHRQICDACKRKTRQRCNWRYALRRMGQPIPPCLGVK